ncbi:MAG: LysM peptidoglycan-binding domain-containing protein [Planctomycetota bacterium]
MPVVEKYGLSILFGLCLLIVAVGLFAEDPAVQAAREKIARTGPEPVVEPASTSGGTDWWPDDHAAAGQPGARKLRAYEPGLGAGPDPARDSSLDIDRVPEPQPEPGPSEQRKDPPVVGGDGWREHVVVKDDTFGSLAQQYLGSQQRWREIAAANPGVSEKNLPRGRTLRIPPATAGSGEAEASGYRTVVVRSGDCLSDIAKRVLGDANRYPEIAKLNEISVKATLQVGTRLKVPSHP